MALLARIREMLHIQEAEMSHSDIRSLLRNELGEVESLGDEDYLWVVDVYDDAVVYEIETGGDCTLYQRSYTLGDGSPSFSDRVEVKRVTTYEPVSEPAAESGGNALNLTGEIVPLIEKAVGDDGLVDIKIIQPGWGSSGYYSDQVLQDAAGAIAAGTHMYIDHPTQTEELERPERSLRELAAVTVEPAVWNAEGAQGPGLYTRAKTFSGFREVLDEIAPHIGVSIRGRGRRTEGEVEGQKGLVVNSIEAMDSIDFVTLPGAGGAIGELVESARAGQQPERTEPVTEQNTNTTPAAESDELTEVKQQLARLQEDRVMRDARDHVTRALRAKRLPDIVAERLTRELAGNPPFTEARELDTEALDAQIEAAVTAELAYLEQVAPSGRVSGMGGQPLDEPELDEAALDAQIETGFAGFGLSESAAKRAAAF